MDRYADLWRVKYEELSARLKRAAVGGRLQETIKELEAKLKSLKGQKKKQADMFEQMKREEKNAINVTFGRLRHRPDPGSPAARAAGRTGRTVGRANSQLRRAQQLVAGRPGFRRGIHVYSYPARQARNGRDCQRESGDGGIRQYQRERARPDPPRVATVGDGQRAAGRRGWPAAAERASGGFLQPRKLAGWRAGFLAAA